MKKFTEKVNDKSNHYANNDKIKNQLYDIIDECLTAKMNEKNSDKLSIIGKEDLINELLKIINNDNIKTQINVLESTNIITETIVVSNTLTDLVNETLKNGNFDTTIRI